MIWNEGDMKTNAAHTFGKILQDARESKDLSLGQAAKLLGVPKTSLWRWENNETKVDAQRLVDIAAAYGLSVPAIFEGRVMVPQRKWIWTALARLLSKFKPFSNSIVPTRIQSLCGQQSLKSSALKHLASWKRKIVNLI